MSLETKAVDNNYIVNAIKPRILVIAPSLDERNGVASNIMNYYRKLVLNYNFDFITYTNIKNKYTDEIVKKGGKVYFFPSSILAHYNMAKQFYAKNANRYAIVHSHTFNYGAVHLFFARKYGISHRIIHAHNPVFSDDFLKNILGCVLMKICVKLSNVYIACSGQTAVRVFKKRPCYVINNAIKLSDYKNGDRDEMRRQLGVEENDIVLGNVGRLVKQKNQLFLIDVFAELKKNKKFRNSKLVIVGNGPLSERLKERISKYKLGDDVRVMSGVKRMSDFYAGIDCFVFPSLYEGLGIALIEAQAAGLQCICSEGVPDDAIITNKVKKIKLDGGVSLWADEIIKKCFICNRDIVVNNSRFHEFDIDNEYVKLLRLYDDLIACKEL